MKIKAIVTALLLFGMSACSYSTCPTYAKKEVKPEHKTAVVKP